MVTCDEKKKVLSSQNVLLLIFLKIRYLIWWYAELNRLLVGSGQIPLNIELKQDDYIVCCSHTVVGQWEALQKPHFKATTVPQNVSIEVQTQT